MLHGSRLASRYGYSGGGVMTGLNDLLNEAGSMPDASVRFARGVSQVWTPDDLIPLREYVRSEHRSAFHRLQVEISERFGTSGARDDYVNVFYAAAEMALMERVARQELSIDDRRTPRRLWESLLRAT